MPDGLNDINVLHRSNIFGRLTNKTALPVSYTINSNTYDMCYYLGDEIYPEWAIIVKAISAPRGNKSVHVSVLQASTRKDVELAFGVLQARFAIICSLDRIWKQNTLHNIMTACVIMHNMIIENERGSDQEEVYDYMGEKVRLGRDPNQDVLRYRSNSSNKELSIAPPTV
ncbi:uncharacterized protein LOC133927596 [Phragmites australis]|uniref:uncharacterized protein LOC133927596 n=1 Tax=Phragmites australis TaxID=29695 RepID=UPI002D76BE14|nr:uncharacterized protein LOC133927596 [Phragmites australis]